MPVESLKLLDIVSWALWEKFGSSPVIGWMRDNSQVIIPKRSSVEGTPMEKEAKQINTSEAKPVVDPLNKIHEIYNECFNSFASDQLLANSDSPEQQETKSQILAQVKQAFQQIVDKVESEGAAAESSESVKMFLALVDQCVASWGTLAEQISSEMAVIDICKEFERLKQVSSESQAQGSNTLPLHEIMPRKGKNAINTTIVFRRNGTKITPGSKLRFYSDPDK